MDGQYNPFVDPPASTDGLDPFAASLPAFGGGGVPAASTTLPTHPAPTAGLSLGGFAAPAPAPSVPRPLYADPAAAAPPSWPQQPAPAPPLAGLAATLAPRPMHAAHAGSLAGIRPAPGDGMAGFAAGGISRVVGASSPAAASNPLRVPATAPPATCSWKPPATLGGLGAQLLGGSPLGGMQQPLGVAPQFAPQPAGGGLGGAQFADQLFHDVAMGARATAAAYAGGGEPYGGFGSAPPRGPPAEKRKRAAPGEYDPSKAPRRAQVAAAPPPDRAAARAARSRRPFPLPPLPLRPRHAPRRAADGAQHVLGEGAAAHQEGAARIRRGDDEDRGARRLGSTVAGGPRAL